MYIGYRTITEKRGPEKVVKKDGRQGDRKKVKRKPDEIIRIKVIEEPLVDEVTFYRVQAIIRKKGFVYHKKRTKDGQHFLYSGFLRCGDCGEPIYTTSGGKNPNKDYYVCRSKKMGNKTKRCSSSYIPKTSIENTITSLVGKELTNVDYMKKLVQKAFNDDTIEGQKIQIEKIKDKINSIDKKRIRLLKLYTDNIYTKEELGVIIEKLNSEKDILNSQRAEIENSYLLSNKVNIEQNIQFISETLFDFPYWSAIQKREFLRRQIPEFIVKKEGVTGITVNFGKLCNHMGTDSSPPPA
jgi:hypothetical protein